MVAAIHNGFVIDPIYERGQWRIIVAKADGSNVRASLPSEPEAVAKKWLSRAYASKENGIEEVKAAIDRGQLA